MPTLLCFWIIHREGNHNCDETLGLFQRALWTRQGDRLVAELRTLLWAPQVANSRHGATYLTVENTVCRWWVPLPKASPCLLGRSLLAAACSSCSQAHSYHFGGSRLNFSDSRLLPYCEPRSQHQHLPCLLSFLLSTSTCNEILIAAHPIKGLLHVNNSWLLISTVGWQARQR